jgi:hypothetical protein
MPRKPKRKASSRKPSTLRRAAALPQKLMRANIAGLKAVLPLLGPEGLAAREALERVDNAALEAQAQVMGVMRKPAKKKPAKKKPARRR